MSAVMAKSAASALHADFGEPLSNGRPHKNTGAAAPPLCKFRDMIRREMRIAPYHVRRRPPADGSVWISPSSKAGGGTGTPRRR